MSNEYTKRFSSTYFLLIIGFAVLAIAEGQTDCNTLASKCEEDARTAAGVSTTDIDNIIKSFQLIKDWPNDLNKDDQGKICKLTASQLPCYAQIEKQCSQDPMFKSGKSLVDRLKELFKCPDTETSGTVDCAYKTELCYGVGLAVSKDNDNEFGAIRDATEENRKTLIEKMEKIKGCLFVKGFGECFDKVEAKCGGVPIVTVTLKAVEAIRSQKQCGGKTTNCANERDKCRREGTDTSGVTQNEIDALLSGTDTQGQINKIGKDKGCKFVKAFDECHGKIKDKCGVEDPNFKPLLELTKTANNQLQCDKTTPSCEEQLNICRDGGMAVSGVPQNEIDAVLSAKDPTAEIEKIGKERGCKFVKAINECHDKIKGQCSAEDPFFKPVLELTKTANNQLQCEKTTPSCEDQLNICRDGGMAVSEVTQKEIDAVLSAKDPAPEIEKIGKDRGCKFQESFVVCHDKIKEQCSAEDPFFKPVLEITTKAYYQLHCGCSSTVASFVLILAAMFLIFNRNI